jgi:hypothetical protein
MRIGLIDVDGHHFPNLALMKLSAWHKQQGDKVEFAKSFEEYDIVYRSKIFTWTHEEEYLLLAQDRQRGGTGYKDYKTVLPAEVERICPDYDLYGCEHAYGFLTRGCIRSCHFCIVPEKEGQIRRNQDIEEFLGGKKSAVLLDNNVLAHPWGIDQIEKIVRLKIKVDFIQGIDYRLIDREKALLLSRVRWLKPLRLACDHIDQLPGLLWAVGILRECEVTPSRYTVYMLVTEDIDSAVTRATQMKEYNLDPFAQAYIPPNGERRTSRQQRRVCRWINRKEIFRSTAWKDYDG